MYINQKNYQKIDSIVIGNKDSTVILPRETILALDESKVAEIVIATSGSLGDDSRKIGDTGLIVATQGEYEFKEIFIAALRNREDDDVVGAGNLNLVEVEIDGVRVVYFADSTNVSRDKLESLGIVDILVLELTMETDVAQKIVNAIDPQIVIPLTSDSSRTQRFESELGVKFTTEKKAKFKASQFTSEDYVLTGLKLEK